MPLTSSPSTQLYKLGKGILSIGEWVGATPPASYTDVGNCSRLEVEVTEEKLAHFSSRAGTRTKDKEIVLGVTGGIAAYKPAEFVRLLTKAEARVHVVMTRNAQEFVTPLTWVGAEVLRAPVGGATEVGDTREGVRGELRYGYDLSSRNKML